MPEHIEDITTGHHAYRIQVGGTMDGTNTRDPVGYGHYGQAWENNVFASIENTGTEAVINPWIVVNERRNWRTIQDILNEILDNDMSNEEKARAIWEFARRHRYHATTADDEVKDTVKMLNVYGYTLCWDEAYTVSNLWQAAGLPVRRGIPHGHCTTEVYYDGKYHLLDSDEHLLFLLRDNETIAGEEDLARDHDLVKRGHAYGILSPESRETSERTAALLIHDGPRAGGRPVIGDHRMDFTLRPGEAMLWEWEDREKYHGYGNSPPRFCNGRLQFIPALKKGFERWCEQAENVAVTDEGLQPFDIEQESIIIYRVRSPYVIVGGKVVISGTNMRLDFSYDGEYWEYVTSLPGTRPRIIPLDEYFSSASPARYEYMLRMRGHGIHIQRLFIETDLQMAPLSLPALEVGGNQVVYTDETPGNRQVQISHGWYERSISSPAAAPALRVPERGATISGTQFKFAWSPVPEAADYHFQLSISEDMKYALSPTFEKLISKTPSAGRAEWHIPQEGLLNPGQTYYWRVRSRNADGLWGAWSDVWHFMPQAPGIPQRLRLETDWTQRRVTLHWEANTQGQPAHHYEVYGSDERGFSISRESYQVVVGGAENQTTFPPNFLTTVESTSVTVIAHDMPWEEGNRCFYRLVAVDEHGVRSGPSDYVESPRPFIYSRPPATAVAGQTTIYQLQVVRSIGDLRAISDDSRRYVTAFRDGDELRFILDEGPAWLHLNETTGLLTATPGPEWVGTHTVTIRVQNRQDGRDVQGFDLVVIGVP